MKKKSIAILLSILSAGMLLMSCSTVDNLKQTATKASNTKISTDAVNYSKADSKDLEVMSYDGDSRASLTLGLRFDYGIQGENQNYQSALNWYQRSVNQGNSNAMVHLGYLYLFGLGTDQNSDQAKQLFTEAATAGNMDGSAALGRYYILHPNEENAAQLALSNIQTAADAKNPMGIYLLGYLYEKGIGVSQDKTEAISLYEELIDTDPSDVNKVRRYPYQEAYVRRAILYLQDILSEAQTSGDSSDNTANNSTDESKKSNSDSKDSSDSSTEDKTNSAEAKKALSLLRKVAETKYAPAQYYLGLVYEKGIGTGTSYTNAITYFTKAADQDYAPAQNRLGYLYFNGLGVDVDYLQCAYYQKLAAAQGYAPAQINLGYLYENGLGVDKNLTVAREYYQLAANQNYQGASESLARVDQKLASNS
ncbi:MAG: tetratricopeptide repeat protein [Lachnospiraceae bacterium]|nr:tetratricopeptide repeat protein [Lachnospiraceae bacterium]